MKNLLRAFFISLILSAYPAAAQNPDAVFPIPNNFGQINEGNVNMFTGDLNFSVPLVTIKGSNLTYVLSLFYNSRSVYVDNFSGFTDNAVGGFGWKLMDYPKMVLNQGNYFLVDGTASYQLYQSSSSGTQSNYSAGGKYYLWKIQRTGSGTNNDTWKLVNENGQTFYFTNPGVVTTGSTIWSFIKTSSAQWGDSLYFSYSGSGDLTSISNLYGEKYTINYSQIGTSARITGITLTRNNKTISKVVLEYSPISIYQTTYNILSKVRKDKAVAPMNLFAPEAPAIEFSYVPQSLSCWAGNYSTGVKWGGTTGTWYNDAPLVITTKGKLVIGNDTIKNPVYNNGVLSWSKKDGNPSQGSVNLMFGSSGSYFWGSSIIRVPCFTGWYQTNSGAVDYRGTRSQSLYNAGSVTSINNPDGTIINYCYEENKIKNTLLVYPIVQFTVNDGYNNSSGNVIDPCTYNSLQYDFTNAAWDTTRVYAQYNSVVFYPGGKFNGGSHDDTHPFGSIENYFFNGSSASSLKYLPANYNQSVITNWAARGLQYLTKVNSDTLVHINDKENTSTTVYWDIGYTTTGVQQTAYSRNSQSVENRLGIQSVSSYIYDDNIHLARKSFSSRYNPQINSSSPSKDSVVTVYTYAFEKYQSLGPNSLNLLTPIAKTVQAVQTNQQGNWDTTYCKGTQWTIFDANGNPNGSSGTWAEWRTYLMNNPTNTSSVFSANPDPNFWNLTQEITKSSPGGSAAGLNVINGLPLYKTYTVKQIADMPVASFNYANPYLNEAFYLGFESYEQPNSSITSPLTIISTDAHTGQNCISTTSFNYAGAINKTAGDYLLGLWVKVNNTQTITVRIASGSTQLLQKNFSVSSSGWKYLNAALLLTNPGSINSLTITVSSSTAFLMDDIRFSPLNYSFSANVYDVNTLQLSANININGGTTLNILNAQGKPIGIAGPDSAKTFRKVTYNYNSRSGNKVLKDSSKFSPKYPNLALTAVSKTSGAWENFMFNNSVYFPPANLNNMSIQSGLLVSNGTTAAPASATYASSVTASNFIMSVEVIPNNLQAGQESGLLMPAVISSVNTNVRFVITSKSYKLYSDNRSIIDSVSIANIPSVTTLVMEIVNQNYLYVYADGRLLIGIKVNGTLNNGAPKIISTNPYCYFDNFILSINPVNSLITFDAQYKTRQSLIRKNETSAIVNEELYGGALNLLCASTRSAVVNSNQVNQNGVSAGIGLQYIQEFAKFNASTMNVDTSSIVAKAFGYDNPYTYSNLYEATPLLTMKSSGSGGTFAADSNGTDYNYGTNNSSSGYSPHTLLAVDEISPDKTTAQNLQNTQGYSFSEYNYAANDTIIQKAAYDKFMRINNAYQPNYFPQGLNQKKFYTSSKYNFGGSLLSYRNPDAGTSQYIYNLTGGIYFRIDSTGLASNPNVIEYLKYDAFGRLSEIGTYNHQWQPDTLQRYANSNSYPNWQSVWKKKYFYNGNNSAPNIGQPTGVQTNNDSNNNPDVYETISYDINGNVIKKTQKLYQTDTTTYAIKYQYDLLQNLVLTDDGNGDPTLFTYSNTGELEKIGTASNPSLYASYIYQDTIITAALNRGTLTRTYDLNPAGWIDGIEDNLLKLTYTYTHGGLDGAGYYTGLVASSTTQSKWQGGPATFQYKYKYDPFGRLIAGYIVETDQNDLNYAEYDDNGNIAVLQRWKDKTLYWASYLTGGDYLQMVQIDNLSNVDSIHNGRNQFYGVAIDNISNKLYWGDENFKIQRANLDGSNAQILPINLSYPPRGLALDLIHNKLYWPLPDYGAMMWSNLDGTNWNYLFYNNGSPQNIAVDPQGGNIYWPDGKFWSSSSPVTIKKANLNGTNIQTIITFPYSSTYDPRISGFDIDTMRNRIYWSTKTKIQSANLDGSNIKDVYSGGTGIQQISLDIFNKQVFWTDGSAIYKINFDSTGFSTVKSGLTNPTWIAQNLRTNIYNYTNGTNRVSGTFGETNTIGYDQSGYITSSSQEGINSISYDSFTNQPASINKSGTVYNYFYNSEGQRILKQSGSNSTLNVIGLSSFPVMSKIKTGASTKTVSYIYGLNGLIALKYNGSIYYVLTDNLNSTRVVTDQNNNQVAYFNYSPFGELMPDATSVSASAPPMNLLFTGKEFDSETGLYNFNVRFYDPNIGRFYSPDPANQYPSPYVYVGNNPVSNIDISGSWGFLSVLGYVGGAVLVVAGAVTLQPEIVVAGLVLSQASFVAGVSTELDNTRTKTVAEVINRSAWKETPLSSYAKDSRAPIDGMNAWQYDDQVRDNLDMNSGHLSFTTILDAGFNGTLDDGRYIYVYRKSDNKIIMRKYDRDNTAYRQSYNYRTNPGTNGQEYLHVRHSQLNGGWQPVWAAGEMRVENNMVTIVNNESGHFKPDPSTLEYVKKTFHAWKIPVYSGANFANFKNNSAADRLLKDEL